MSKKQARTTVTKLLVICLISFLVLSFYFQFVPKVQAAQINSCDSTTDWTPSAATLTIDTSDFIEGSGSLKVTPSGTVWVTYARYDPAGTWDWSGSSDISVYVKADYAKPLAIEIFTDWSNYGSISLGTATTSWTKKTGAFSSLSIISGTVNWHSISFFRLKYDPENGAYNVRYDDIRVPATTSPIPTFSGATTNTTLAGNTTQFSMITTVESPYTLSHYVFSTNNTGVQVNGTVTAFTPSQQSATASYVIALTSTVGNHIQWCAYANTSNGDWAKSDWQNLTTTSYTSTAPFQIRIADMMADLILPNFDNSYYTTEWQACLDDLVDASPNGEITHVQMRVWWNYSSSDTIGINPQLGSNDASQIPIMNTAKWKQWYLGNGSVAYGTSAIQRLHAAGFGLEFAISGAWEGDVQKPGSAAYPPRGVGAWGASEYGGSFPLWTAAGGGDTFLDNYYNNVIYPTAIVCAQSPYWDQDKDIFFLSFEMSYPTSSFTWLHNAKWSEIISNVRTIFTANGKGNTRITLDHCGWFDDFGLGDDGMLLIAPTAPITGSGGISGCTYLADLDFISISWWMPIISSASVPATWSDADITTVINGWYSNFDCYKVGTGHGTVPGVLGRNWVEEFWALSNIMDGKKIVLNTGYENRHGMISTNPRRSTWTVPDAEEQKYDWIGQLRALTYSTSNYTYWLGGQDFERYVRDKAAYPTTMDTSWRNSPAQYAIINEIYSILTQMSSETNYTLTVQSTSGGTVVPTIGNHVYSSGTEVPLYANPSSGYVFAAWEIDGVIETTTENIWSVTMDTDHTAKAYFALSGSSTSSSTSLVTTTSTITWTSTSTTTSTTSGTSTSSSTTMTTSYTTSSTLTSSSTSTIVVIGGTNITMYFRSDERTMYDVSGYALDTTNTASPVTISDSIGAGPSVFYSFDVELLHYGGLTTILGEKVGTIEVTAVAAAYKIGLWNCPQYGLNLGYDALRVTVYSKIGDNDWTAKGVFVSSQLLSSQLTYQSWQFSIYINRTSTASNFMFGSETYGSKIEGIGLKTPTDNELQSYRWNSGDTVSFILGAYTDRIGSVAYLLILLIPSATLYVRHKNTSAVVFAFILFGGPGGIAWFFVPVWAAAVIDLFLVLGYAFLVFKVIR